MQRYCGRIISCDSGFVRFCANLQEKEKLAVEAAMDALREEYQHRISAAERKVQKFIPALLACP